MAAVFVDASELARRLGVGVGTIRYWTRMGRLPHLRDGRRRVMYNTNAVLESLREPKPRNLRPGEKPSDRRKAVANATR